MTRGLIIGYGRAGKRHAKMLDELGIKWVFCDPNIKHPPGTGRIAWEVIQENLDILRYDYSFAVIASPPALHLSQIRQCLDAGLPVLCEKPLCALGQLEEAEALLSHPNASKAMVAYNYRFHPKLIQARNKRCDTGLFEIVAPTSESYGHIKPIKDKFPKVPQWMTCYQDRELPEWGLLLDHVPHDLDILRFLCGEVSIQSARYYPVGSFAHDTRRQMWEIIVKVHGLPDWQQQTIRLRESVGTYPDRKAKLEYEDGAELDIDPNPVMFRDMWESFLGGRYEPGLEEAIKTQRLLEDAWRMSNES